MSIFKKMIKTVALVLICSWALLSCGAVFYEGPDQKNELIVDSQVEDSEFRKEGSCDVLKEMNKNYGPKIINIVDDKVYFNELAWKVSNFKMKESLSRGALRCVGPIIDGELFEVGKIYSNSTGKEIGGVGWLNNFYVK